MARDARFCVACGNSLAGGGARPAGDHVIDSHAGLVGREVAGRYRILAKLGEGGMGAVYRAEQISLKRIVALKVLRPELSAEVGMVRRFNAEAELAAKLSHPNTVTLYDFGQDADGSLFIAMEYLEGRSLRDVLAHEGALVQGRALAICEQLCASLSDAHAHGIVHRDLKPDNVMLVQRGRQTDIVRVLDFGIAKLRDEQGDVTAMPMTRAGDLIGTPQYMAPEQIRGERVDARTDIYALGAMLYEVVTGCLAFEAATLMAILSKHLTEMPVPPSARRPDLRIAPALSQLIMDALHKDPGLRPPTMDAFADRLARLAVEVGPRSGQQPVDSGEGYPPAPALADNPPPGVPLLRTPMPGSVPGIGYAAAIPSPIHSPHPVAYAAPGSVPGPFPSPPVYASPAPGPYPVPGSGGLPSPFPGAHGATPPGMGGGMRGPAPAPMPATPVRMPAAVSHPTVQPPAAGRRSLWIVMGAIAAAAAGGVIVFLVARDQGGTEAVVRPAAPAAPAAPASGPVSADFSLKPERQLYGGDAVEADDDDDDDADDRPMEPPELAGQPFPGGMGTWRGGWWKDPTGTLELDIPEGFSVGSNGGARFGGASLFSGVCGRSPCVIYAVCSPTYGVEVDEKALQQMMWQMQRQMPEGAEAAARIGTVRVNGREHHSMVIEDPAQGTRGQVVVFRGAGTLAILLIQAPRESFDNTEDFRKSFFEKRVRIR